MTDTVLIVAKAPARGRSKTRLTPPLSSKEAAALQEALLLDTVDGCRAEEGDVRILYANQADLAPLTHLGTGVPLIPQHGAGLADALEHAISTHTVDGPVAIVSSDIPGIPAGSLRQAFHALTTGADVVLGPAYDGGYWLIAVSQPHPQLFRAIPWSTPAVLASTRERCQQAGLRLVELEPWRDIDTPVDLAFLARDAHMLAAPRTLAAIAALDRFVSEPPTLELTASELIAGSPWRVMLRDTLRGTDGETRYEYLAVPRAVFVAAITLDNELLLVRQYRHPVRDWTLEVPAGSVYEGETAFEAARRELREEVGGNARRWQHLSAFFSSSAHLSLRSDAFLALDVELSEPKPEPGEELTIVRLPLATALRHARSGKFTEGQTALTILLALERLRERAPAGA